MPTTDCGFTFDEQRESMNYDDAVKKWNSQADHLNQWPNLGEDEKIEFALKVQSDVIRSHLNYIAAYDIDELDGMTKDKLLMRARAIITGARNTLRDDPMPTDLQAVVAKLHQHPKQ